MTKQKKSVETPDVSAEQKSNPTTEKQPSSFPVPEKFQNADGSLKAETLLKSYLALEQKLGHKIGDMPTDRPEKPEDYQIEIKSNLMANDPEINRRLFDLGLTNAQAQGIYDLAAEKIIPVIEELAETFQTRQDLSDLEQRFGGADQFNTVARQISQWGEKNLDPAVFQALVSTKDGILTLYKMMCSTQETPVLPRTDSASTDLSEEDLKRLMQDPKYWKQQDPEWLKRVENGFKRLYG